MSVEDLLKPRYKVIADYPGSDYHIGEILDRDWGWVGNDEVGFKHHISHYPHLFKKLQWWEDRDEKDMPEYVKFTISSKTDYFKILKWNMKEKFGYINPEFNWQGCSLTQWGPTYGYYPATKEEYENNKK